MDLRYTDAQTEFGVRLRRWLSDAVPAYGPRPGGHDWQARREYDTGWQRTLFNAGYAGVDWPEDHGGLGATPIEQLIYLEESALARAPYVGANFVGLLHAGPTLIVEGTDEQRAKHLAPILRGEHVWCQGFSEPDSGSDLASLRTSAVREGDEYVINGRKIWTSMAQIADYCELLVRTDSEAPKHKGISWLILPMDTPGVQVRPLVTAAGSSEFSELVLDNVRVPVSSRVGAEHDGWRVAMTTFSFERGTAFIADVVESRNMIAELADFARATEQDDVALRHELGLLAAEVNGLWALTRKNVSDAESGRVPVQGASVFKLKFSENRQHLGDLANHVLGRAALGIDERPGSPLARYAHLVEDRITSLSWTIAAGTSQIQKNILAERSLGLPKEPKWT